MPSQWIPVSLSPKNYQFVSLEQPDGKGPDISFVESSCCNSEWDASRKDGKAMVYFPTMSADGQLCIRAFDVSAEKPTTSIVMTVSLGNDSSSMLSCYGSKLSAQGIMWMCMFSANKVIGVDLATKKMSHEFSGIPCPNDLCLDSKDSNSIYVAAGLGITACSDGHCPGDKLVAALPFVGRVYLIDIAKRKSGVFLESSDFRALAGICASQGSLFISQLFETRAVTLAAAAAGGKSTKTAAVWEGNEVGDGASYFLADNISTWDDEVRRKDKKKSFLKKSLTENPEQWRAGQVEKQAAALSSRE
uniref:Uncharacterized protein n=1 Tax=Cryptomonas curvata TaxID=233186 RepID=A0A7S0MIW9_9CRYP|mmetsp:Transcript_43543/g.91179  ORF Transcript_43543/g.91179 Transcript_43543/m.91179 type:complete len:304 (+) Transcript_43543:59-970(+)